MKRRPITTAAISILSALFLVATPLSAVAEDTVPPPDIPEAPIIITEVQTGAGVSGQADDEFIELYNASDEDVDLTGWQLRFVSATAATATIDKPSFKVDVSPPMNGEEVMSLAPGGHYVLHTESLAIPGQVYAGHLTASGSLVLFAPPDIQTCERTAIDAVAWGAGLLGDGSPVPTASKDKVVVRLVDEEGNYVVTADNLHDFGAFDPTLAGSATPGIMSTQQLAEGAVVSQSDTLTTGQLIDEASCTLPEPEDPGNQPDDDSPPSTTIPSEDEEPEDDNDREDDDSPAIPVGNIGLKPPQISELLPNPASPQTDANDEFVELYNPNDAPFDLSGYVLESGIATKHRYVFMDGTGIQPRSFAAFFSADTGLALSNTSGQVRLIDPLGEIIVEGDQYASAKDGQAWLLANGSWQWTTRPTPNSLNVVSLPVVKAAATAKAPKKSVKKPAKSSKTTKPSSQGPSQDVQDATSVAATTSTPLHPGVLALVAVSALLYGAYEYRHDVANKIYQLRGNRAARREIRQSAKGR